MTDWLSSSACLLHSPHDANKCFDGKRKNDLGGLSCSFSWVFAAAAAAAAAEILITIRQGLICFPPVKKSNNYIIPSYIQWTLKNAKENWGNKENFRMLILFYNVWVILLDQKYHES